MKRPLLIACLALLAVFAAAAGWHWLRPRDPAAQANAMLARGNVRGAQLVMRSAVLNHPNDARSHFMLAAVELRSGDPAGAEREAHEAAQRGYDPAAVAVVLAQATVQQHRYADALRDYQPTPGMTPSQAAAIDVQRGLAQAGLGHAAEAGALIGAARQRDPNSFEADMAAEQLARASNDLPAATRAVDHALTLDPNAAPALLARADLLNLAGDRKGALAAYDVAVAHANGSLIPLLAQADLLTIMGDTARARANLDTALKAQPQSPIANFLLARLLIAAGQWTAADAALTKAQPIIDQVPRGNYLLAVVKTNLGQPQQALDAAAAYLAKAPAGDRTEAARLLGELSLRNKDPARAVSVLEPLASSGKADVPMLRMLAAAYQQTGNGPAAVRSLEQASRLAPNDPTLLTALASARIGAGDLRSATADLQRALDAPGAAAPLVPANLATSTAPSAGPSQADTAMALVLTAIQAGDPDSAATALKRLRTMPGVEPSRISLLSGMVKLARFDLAGAEADIQSAVTAKPADVAARVELARVIAIRGDKPRAEQMLSAMVDKDPANAVVLTSLVPMLLEDGKPDQAVRRMTAAHDAAPANASLTLTLAQLLARTGQPKQALALVEPLAPGLPPAQMLPLRAGLQAQAGHLKEAAATMRQVAGMMPNNPGVAQGLVQMLLAGGDVDGAKAAAQSALVANPGNAGLLSSVIAIANRQGGQAAALSTADQLAQDPANQPAALPLKGDFLMSEKRFADAQAAYEAAYATAPSTALVTRIALAEQSAGKTDAATTRLRGWLTSHPDDAAVAAVLASLDLAAKRPEQARGELQVVLAQHPDDAASLNNLAVVEQQTDHLPRARELAQRAYLLQPSGQTADTLGWIMVAEGDAQDGLPLLRQASETMKADPGVQYHYAAALQKTGRSGDAAAILKRLVTQDGAFAEKADARRLLAASPHG